MQLRNGSLDRLPPKMECFGKMDFDKFTGGIDVAASPGTLTHQVFDTRVVDKLTVQDPGCCSALVYQLLSLCVS